VDDNLENLQSKLKQFSTVIIGYHKSDIAWRVLILANRTAKISVLAKKQQCNTDVFASPYSWFP
jgi:hypothetical protein